MESRILVRPGCKKERQYKMLSLTRQSEETLNAEEEKNGLVSILSFIFAGLAI